MFESCFRKRALFPILAASFLDNFGTSLLYVLFASLLLDPSRSVFFGLEYQGVLLGILMAAFQISAFFGAPFWGDFADRFGRKRAFLFTLLGTAAGHLLSIFAIFLECYGLLLAARAIAGLFSAQSAVSLAAVSDASPEPAAKGKNLTLWAVTLGLGWILAIGARGYFSASSFPIVPFCIAAVSTFGAYLIICFTFVETRPNQEFLRWDLAKSGREIKTVFRFQELRSYLTALLFWCTGAFAAYQWQLSQAPTFAIGANVAFLSLSVLWMAAGVFLNRLLAKRHFSALGLASVLSTFVLILMSGAADSYLPFSFFFWSAALLAPLALSGILYAISSSVLDSIQGKAMGLALSFQSMAALLALFGARGMGASSIFPMACLLLSFAVLSRKKQMHRWIPSIYKEAKRRARSEKKTV